MSTPTATYLNTGPYQEIISGISTVFSFSDGVVKLTGPLGAGKSSLLQELCKELRGESFEVVDFKVPPKSAEDLQSTLIRKFKLGADLSFRKSLIRYLSTKPRDLQKLILVIDDVQQMGVEALAGLHALRDLDSNGQTLISVLLCGDKTLNAHLAQAELAALQADISLNYSLNPLEEAELSEFCSTWLQQAGKGRIALNQSYLEGLRERTRGLPGEILAELETGIADPLFLIQNKRGELPPAVVEKEPALIGQVIHNIAEQINNIPPETKRWLKPTANILFAAAAASTVYVYYPNVIALYKDHFQPDSQPASTGPAQIAATPAPATAAPATPAPTTAPSPQPAATAVVTPAPVTQPQVAQAPATPPAPTAQTPVAPPVQTQTASPATPAVTVARANTPAPAPTVIATTPAPAIVINTAPASAAELEAVVNNWLAAWQHQDTNAYLGFYHTDFASLYHNNRNSWREDRIRSLTRPARIDLSLSDLQVAGSDVTGTTVSFKLDYQSPTYADRTAKELVLGRDTDGQLRILRELNKEVEVQPPGHLVAASPATAAQPRQSTAAAGVKTATRVGEPMVIQPNAEVAGLQNNRDNINQFISSWLNSWQHKDLDGYFSHYDPQFKASSTESTDAWRDDRTVKIIRPAVIQLQLETMELVNENSDGAVLHLTLDYHSTYYADRTQKEIKLQRGSDGILHIVEEKNIAVETLPLSRLLPSNRVAMRELARSLTANQL